MAMSYPEATLAAWSFLLSQRKAFLNDRSVQFLLTPNQEGTMAMCDGMLSSVGADVMDTSG